MYNTHKFVIEARGARFTVQASTVHHAKDIIFNNVSGSRNWKGLTRDEMIVTKG